MASQAKIESIKGLPRAKSEELMRKYIDNFLKNILTTKDFVKSVDILDSDLESNVKEIENILTKNSFSIIIEKIHPNAKIPTKAYKNSAGFDLFALNDEIINPGERKKIPTGIKIKIKDYFYGQILSRSGLALKKYVDVVAGLIDSNYEGELFVVLHNNHKSSPFIIKTDNAIAQFVLIPSFPLSIHVSDGPIQRTRHSSVPSRGSKGFGSSDEKQNLDSRFKGGASGFEGGATGFEGGATSGFKGGASRFGSMNKNDKSTFTEENKKHSIKEIENMYLENILLDRKRSAMRALALTSRFENDPKKEFDQWVNDAFYMKLTDIGWIVRDSFCRSKEMAKYFKGQNLMSWTLEDDFFLGMKIMACFGRKSTLARKNNEAVEDWIHNLIENGDGDKLPFILASNIRGWRFSDRYPNHVEEVTFDRIFEKNMCAQKLTVRDSTDYALFVHDRGYNTVNPTDTQNDILERFKKSFVMIPNSINEQSKFPLVGHLSGDNYLEKRNQLLQLFTDCYNRFEYYVSKELALKNQGENDQVKNLRDFIKDKRENCGSISSFHQKPIVGKEDDEVSINSIPPIIEKLYIDSESEFEETSDSDDEFIDDSDEENDFMETVWNNIYIIYFFKK